MTSEMKLLSIGIIGLSVMLAASTFVITGAAAAEEIAGNESVEIDAEGVTATLTNNSVSVSAVTDFADVSLDVNRSSGIGEISTSAIDSSVERDANAGLCAAGLDGESPTSIDVDGDDGTVTATFEPADGDTVEVELDEKPEPGDNSLNRLPVQDKVDDCASDSFGE